MVDLHPSDENLLRAVRFERPDAIPLLFHVNDACRRHYPRAALDELMAGHPLLFPGFEPGAEDGEPAYAVNARAGEPFTDPWGCVWETSCDGIVGVVTGHPLGDWAAFEGFRPPDPAQGDGFGRSSFPPIPPEPVTSTPVPRPARTSDVTLNEGTRRLRRGGLRHGHTFLQLCDLRGYENLIFDMTDGDPRLERLVAMVEKFNRALVDRDLAAGAEWMEYPEDLGMQTGPLLTPAQFCRTVKPVYERLMEPARRAGCVVHFHCDGHLHALADDLLACPIDVLNLQDRVNGVDWIAARIKGRVAVDLDIDRQEVTVRGTPAGIDALIRREVETLGSREGGLMLTYGLYPGLPLENVAAVMDAMERYALHFSG